MARMSDAEKAARKQARLEAHGPVVGQIASKDKPDVYYDVRFLRGLYWCPCIGFAIRKACRHALYCENKGFTTPMTTNHVVTGIANAFLARLQEIRGRLANQLSKGDVFVSVRRDDARWMLDELTKYGGPSEPVGVGISQGSTVFAGRRIVLED